MPVPRENRSLNFGLAFRAHEAENRAHNIDRRRTFDRHGERSLMVFTPRSQRHYRPIEKPCYAFDYVAVGHADTD